MPNAPDERKIRIALIGDRDPAVTAHIANPKALELSAAAAGCAVESEWLPTDAVLQSDLARFDAFWCVPASPYRSMDGALHAIRFARENRRPFLGTCAGFQHALVEFARNVAGISAADFEETNPRGESILISRLACSLVEKDETIRILPATRLAQIHPTPQIVERYHCNFGVNPAFRARLESAGIRWTAEGAGGEVRAFELPSHPFFIGTLFQPERAALLGVAPPVVTALLRAAAEDLP